MTSADDPAAGSAAEQADPRRAPGSIRGPIGAVIAGFLFAIAFSVGYTTWSVNQRPVPN